MQKVVHHLHIKHKKLPSSLISRTLFVPAVHHAQIRSTSSSRIYTHIHTLASGSNVYSLHWNWKKKSLSGTAYTLIFPSFFILCTAVRNIQQGMRYLTIHIKVLALAQCNVKRVLNFIYKFYLGIFCTARHHSVSRHSLLFYWKLFFLIVTEKKNYRRRRLNITTAKREKNICR